MKKSNITFSKSEVEDIANAMLSRIGGGFKFGGWIDFEDASDEMAQDFCAGIYAIDDKGYARLAIHAGCTLNGLRNIFVSRTIEYFQESEIYGDYISFEYLGNGESILHKTEISKDGILAVDEWELFGLNRYLIMSMNELNHL